MCLFLMQLKPSTVRDQIQFLCLFIIEQIMKFVGNKNNFGGQLLGMQVVTANLQLSFL